MIEADRRRSGRPLIGVGAVLLDPHERVLLVQRGHPPAQGKWSVPGGLVERGERLIEACAREVREETGLEVALRPQPVKLLERVLPTEDEASESSIAYHYLIIDFWGRPTGGALSAGSDVLQARWVDLDEMASLPTTAGLHDVVRRAQLIARGEAPPSSPLLEGW